MSAVQPAKIFVGVDVSKNTLDVYLCGSGSPTTNGSQV
jgi:hypothetical protein